MEPAAPPADAPGAEATESDLAAILSTPAPPPAKLEIRGRSSVGSNYTAAFVLFCKGMSLREIADEFDIKYAVLTARARAEDWDGLMNSLQGLVAPKARPEVVALSAEKVKAHADAIDAHRARGLSIADGLQKQMKDLIGLMGTGDHAILQRVDAFIARLESGEAVKRREIQSFIEGMEEFRRARAADVLTLAKSAKLVNEVGMLALGDPHFVAAAAEGRGSKNDKGIQIFSINLPSVVSAPRGEMEKTVHELEEAIITEAHIAEKDRAIVGPKSSNGRTGVDFSALPTK